jgi:hypothetical protein
MSNKRYVVLLHSVDVNSIVSFNSANITTPSSYEVKTETASHKIS